MLLINVGLPHFVHAVADYCIPAAEQSVAAASAAVAAAFDAVGTAMV